MIKTRPSEYLADNMVRHGHSRAAFALAVVALALASSVRLSVADTVAYWRMENGTADAPASGAGTVLDSSGNGLNGTPTNGPTYRANVGADPVPTTGAANLLSLDFNGTDQRIFILDSPLFKLTNSLTLEAWVYVRPVLPSNFAGQIIFRGDDNGGLDPYYLVVLPNGNFQFTIQSTVELQTPVPSFNEWHHVAGTLDDATGQMKLYVDGVLQASTVTSVRPLADLDPTQMPGLGIGDVQSDTYPEHFNGLIDEVRISDQALAPDEFLVPEPSTHALAAIGLFGLLAARLFRKVPLNRLASA